MASIILDAIKSLGKTKHNVGSLNNWGKDLVNQGAIVTGGVVDNFCLVELDFNEKGERICKALSASEKKGFIVASVEDYIEDLESMSAFYNGIGDRARIVVQVPHKRFEVSNFVGENTGKAIKNGQKVHYDHATKKYIVSNNGSDHSGYAAAANKYVVVDAEGNILDGQQVIRLEIIA